MAISPPHSGGSPIAVLGGGSAWAESGSLGGLGYIILGIFEVQFEANQPFPSHFPPVELDPSHGVIQRHTTKRVFLEVMAAVTQRGSTVAVWLSFLTRWKAFFPLRVGEHEHWSGPVIRTPSQHVALRHLRAGTQCPRLGRPLPALLPPSHRLTAGRARPGSLPR